MTASGENLTHIADSAFAGPMDNTIDDILRIRKLESLPSSMSKSQMSHSEVSLKQWDKLQQLLTHTEQAVEIDGKSIDVPTLVAVARSNTSVHVHESCVPAIEKSASYFKRCLDEGCSIYGVNTGFGGSADTRTDNTRELQNNLIDFLNCGITLTGGVAGSEEARTTTIPETWVRASMLVRANSLARGHSGVRRTVIGGLIDFLNKNVTPVIPLRGSVSASGDLIPLSYIAGALQGRDGVCVWANAPSSALPNGAGWIKGYYTPPTPTISSHASYVNLLTDTDSLKITPMRIPSPTSPSKPTVNAFQPGLRQTIKAHEALVNNGLNPIELEPKEGLSLVNGTAVSAGTAALIAHDTQGIASLAQVLTAMSVEAFTGSFHSFQPFLGHVRPHPGQIEAAQNIRCFLKGSKLATGGDDEAFEDNGGLRQDRYSLRTTPQWIGPQLENLMLAYQQVEIECNSTTDNPLVDTEKGEIVHGGNFQALSITSAMEKIRQSLQQFGRMLFVQCSELINPAFNNGLPPNLEAGEPSQGFLMKGIDISIASLCSELGYLANPLTPHVQTAEMGNQSLNSMAFVSARYTHTALEVMSQLAAAHIFVVCQALDLRCIQQLFYKNMRLELDTVTQYFFSKHVKASELPDLKKQLWSRFTVECARTTSQDSSERFQTIFESLQKEFLATPNLEDTATLFVSLTGWTASSAEGALRIYKRCFTDYISHQSTKGNIGAASYRIWDYVRHDLQVPFHVGKDGFNALDGEKDASVGEMVTKIYVAIRSGGLIGVVMECVREARAAVEMEGLEECD